MIGRTGRHTTTARPAEARSAGRLTRNRGSCSRPTHPTAAGPTRQVDELHRRHHHELQRATAGAVRAPSELIEDARQTAWMDHAPQSTSLPQRFGWLRAVAVHEALSLDGDRAPLETQ